MDGSRRRRNEENSDDWPVYSRLFVVCERNLDEEVFIRHFSEFGTIEDVRIPRDHNTGERKGIVFIKFSKTSEAANALEAMNLKFLPDSTRPLKVMVAANRSDIQSDIDDDERYKRLFLNVSKTENETTLQSHFGHFGEIEYIIVQRHKDSGESKGFAYVKFRRFSEAAKAYEQCDRKYKAIFAQPKASNKRHETTFESNINSLAMSSANIKTSLVSMMRTNPGNFTRVNFICCPYLTQMHVERLFDIVPGMVECNFHVDFARNFGRGIVSYSNPVSASYAVQKLNKLEYPPGMKIFVKPDNYRFDPYEQNFSTIPNTVNKLRKAITSTASSCSPDLAQLAEAIAEASKLVKMYAGASDQNLTEVPDLNYCSVKLPPRQPLADIDSKAEKRCFLVCKPQPPALTVLRDVFCRFGDLISVYTLPNKTVGYASYAKAESADEAIKTLHGAEICGVRVKVLEADAKPDDYDQSSSKRKKYEY